MNLGFYIPYLKKLFRREAWKKLRCHFQGKPDVAIDGATLHWLRAVANAAILQEEQDMRLISQDSEGFYRVLL